MGLIDNRFTIDIQHIREIAGTEALEFIENHTEKQVKEIDGLLQRYSPGLTNHTDIKARKKASTRIVQEYDKLIDVSGQMKENLREALVKILDKIIIPITSKANTDARRPKAIPLIRGPLPKQPMQLIKKSKSVNLGLNGITLFEPCTASSIAPKVETKISEEPKLMLPSLISDKWYEMIPNTEKAIQEYLSEQKDQATTAFKNNPTKTNQAHNFWFQDIEKKWDSINTREEGNNENEQDQNDVDDLSDLQFKME